MGVLLIILLQKITTLKKQTDDIIKEVKAYVAYVTEETEEEVICPEQLESRVHRKNSRDEVQSHIIQAVLGEYFP